MPDDFINIEQREGEDIFDILGNMPDKALRYLKEAVEDIADEIEATARELAPEDTGELKAHPVDRRDLKRRVQGPGGLVVKSEISVPKVPVYAKWVHDGTGIYGPHGTPIVPRKSPFIMRFQIDGKWFAKKSVQGQQPQPYLKEAVEEVERTFVPVRLAELRAKLELLT